MKIFYSLLILGFLSSCKDAPEAFQIDGQYVSSVNNKVVHLQNTENTLDLSDSQKIFYLVRHAEKDTIGEPGNPPLTEQGNARASALKEILKGTRLDEIYSTLYLRTLMTAEPIATSKGMKILPYNAGSLRVFVDSLTQRSNLSSALIVGHSNTTPALANALSKSKNFDKNIDESDYDNLYILASKSDTTWNTYALRFSIPSLDNKKK